MVRYCDLAADLLKEAADFFIRISESRPDAIEQMHQNAATYRHMSDLIRNDPEGRVEHLTHAEMAARLMEDAALFFESVGQVNLLIQEQMNDNSSVFRQMAKKIRENPTLSATGN